MAEFLILYELSGVYIMVYVIIVVHFCCTVECRKSHENKSHILLVGCSQAPSTSKDTSLKVLRYLNLKAERKAKVI